MKNSRLLTVMLVLVLVVALTLLAGCNNSTTNQTESPSGETTPVDDNGESIDTQTSSYTMFMRLSYVNWIKELEWYDEAEEITGIHVEYVEGPDEFADVYSEIDQRIISDTMPDTVMTKLAQTNVYGSQGVFMDLAPMIEKYAPNLQAYIDSNPIYAALITNEDGAIYGLVKETPIFADFIGYRVDQFEKAGVDAESIKTIDDFTDVLRTLKEHYGADNKNYYPLCGRDSALRFAAWFGCASNISSTESNGVYLGHYKDGSYDIMDEDAYTMMETMKLWYDEGLINPEWIAGTAGEADWEATMLNGNGSIFYDYYNRAQWFMDNGGTDADPDYQMGVLNFLQDENGNTIKVTTCTKYNDELVTGVNADCSEETVESFLTFIDFFYTEEGLTLTGYGVEGESYEVNADGTKSFIVDYSVEESKATGEKRWSFLNDRFTVCKPVDDYAFFQWNAPLIAEAAGRLLVSENLMTSYTLSFTETQSKELSNLVAAVYDAQSAGIVSLVNGSRELTPEEWATFQQEMDDLGLSRIEEIQLEAYQNTYGK